MTNEELQADNEELKDMVKDYEELLESKKEECLEYKEALGEIETIVRKLV